MTKIKQGNVCVIFVKWIKLDIMAILDVLPEFCTRYRNEAL